MLLLRKYNFVMRRSQFLPNCYINEVKKGNPKIYSQDLGVY